MMDFLFTILFFAAVLGFAVWLLIGGPDFELSASLRVF